MQINMTAKMNRTAISAESHSKRYRQSAKGVAEVGSPTETSRIPELDGLRGIAIGMVLIWHYFTTTAQVQARSPLAYLLTATGLTWSGVDLFFVLSGFLIGGILLDARGATNYFQVFYRRRFFRIVPIYAAVLLVFPILALLRNAGHPAPTASAPPWYMYWTFTQNFWMAATSSLGTNSLAMTWSLAVEEQFYLTLPLLVFHLSPRQLRRVVLAGIVLAPILRLAIHFLWPHNSGANYVLMPCRADALLLGVLTAILLRDPVAKARIQNSSLIPLAFSTFLLGTLFLLLRAPDGASPLMSTLGFTWLALLYVTTLIFAVTRPASFLSNILRQKWLCWLGSIAYGVYLLHQGAQRMVFRFFSIDLPVVNGIYSLLITLVALACTLLLARLSWTYFEKPLVRIGHRSDYKFLRDLSNSELADSPATGD